MATRAPAEEALSILGWEFKEGTPSADIFTSVGVSFFLCHSSNQGVIAVLDKPERADRANEVSPHRKFGGSSLPPPRRPSAAKPQFPSVLVLASCGGLHLKELGGIVAGAGVAWSSRRDLLSRY